MNKKQYLPIIFLLVLQTHLFSQTVAEQTQKLVPKPVPQSPNVASLGKYGDYKVNLYTGLPDISIPIFEATSGNLKVPITLSYHAAGHRYTDQASWVGLGWSLSAGGQVSRNTVGKPDEEYYYNNALGTASVCSNYYYVKSSATSAIDTEPDVFSYSFPGKSGKFLLGQYLGTVSEPYYLIPYEPIKLEPTYSSSQFTNFKITDEHGVAYNFGTSETTGSDNGGVTTTSKTAWHLNTMTAPNSNDLITFTYQNAGMAYMIDASDHMSVTDLCSSSPNCATNTSVVTESLNVSTVTQQGLDEIFFEGGKVKFVLGAIRTDQHVSASLKSLDKIEVYSLLNGVYSKVKTFQFVYTYFTNSAGNVNLRLKLNELQVLDANGQPVQRYQFDYYTNTFSWDTPTLSKRRDYMGYFNNKSGNTSLIPTTQIDVQWSESGSPGTLTIGSADRSTDTTYLKEGVLKKITYPTKGYTEFKYEPNQYVESSVVKYPGELRIRKILSYDGIQSQPVVKSYKYGEGETGNGIQNFLLSKSFFASEQRYYYWGAGGGNAIYSNRVKSYVSSSTYALDSYDGSPVVYPVVTEYTGDFTSHLGKTVFEFDNKVVETDQPFVVPNSGKNFKDSRHWKRGKLTKKIVYKSTGEIVSLTETTYQLYQNQNKSVGIGAATYQIFPNGQQTFPWGIGTCLNEIGELVPNLEFFVTTYPQSTGAYRETAATEYIYENGDVNKYVAKSSYNSFDATYLLLKESTVSGKLSGEYTSTRIKYPFDFTYTGSETGTPKAMRLLKEKNVLSAPVEQYSMKQVGANQSIVGGQIISYKENPANLSQVIGDQVYMLETDVSIPVASYTAPSITSSALNLDSRYKLGMNMVYDGLGNTVQVQRPNDQFMGYQWGYDNSLPVAEVTNAQNNKHTIYVNSTSNTSISMGGMTPQSTSKIFTVDYTGSVTLKLGMTGTPAYTTYADYSGVLGSGTLTLTNGQSCGYNQVTFSNVAPGTYTINITLRASVTNVSVGACGQVDYPVIVPQLTGITEFFNEGFEEGSATGTATPHTGKKYLIGDYTNTFIKPNTRNYVIEYWYLSGGVWQYATATYSNSMVLTSGDAIDDVRIYPADAQMKSYSYTPGIGITATIDERGKVYKYEYDSFGRLLRIVNESGGIEKQYTYQYKTN